MLLQGRKRKVKVLMFLSLAFQVCKMKEEKRVHRVSLKVSAETPVLKPFNSTQIKDSKTVLKGYEEREETIRQRASAFNGLEAYIYNTREKLENNEEVKAVTTPESREKFTEELNKVCLAQECCVITVDFETERSLLPRRGTAGRFI